MEDFWEEKESDFNFKEIFFKYLRRWWWFILGVTFTLSAAWLYVQKTAPLYKVSASVLIKDEKKGGLGSNEVLKELDMISGSKIVDNEIEVIKSRSLLEKVVDELNLTVKYATEGVFRDTEIFEENPIKINYTQLSEYAYENPMYIHIKSAQKFEVLNQDKQSLGEFMFTQAIKSPYGTLRVFRNKDIADITEPIKISFAKRDAVVDYLRDNVNVELLSKNSTVLQLNLEHANTAKGKQIISKLLEVYTFTNLEDKNREASNTLRFIEERLKLITGELTEVEQNVEQYRNQAGITNLSVESNLFLEKVKENDVKLNEVDIQLRVLDGVENYLNSNQAAAAAPATLMVQDPALTSYISNLSELEMEKERLQKTTGARANNPLLNTVNTQIENTRQAIRENLNSQKQSLAIRKSGLVGTNNRLESAIRTIPRKEREYVGIQRQQNIKESLYMVLLQKREETALSYASTVTDSRIVDQPSASSEPVKPKKKIVYLGAILLGLLIPVGIITLKELLTDTVQSKKEIEEKTGLEVFGEIALKDKTQGNIIDSKDRGFIPEQFRTIRTNLPYLNTEEKEKGITYIMTSSMSGEGKTFVTINLANTLAALGKKVAVLELDLRKPKLSEYLGMSRDKGITNYLMGKVSETDIIKPTMIDNMFLISSGPIPPNPSELISGEKFKRLIQLYQQSFDYLIMDTPPVGLVSDAIIMGPLADAAFYIVRHQVTNSNQLKIVKDINTQKKFKRLNILFNGVNYKESKDYNYGYGGYYGYGEYGYGQEAKKPFWKVWS